jgi:hypothetical protein
MVTSLTAQNMEIKKVIFHTQMFKSLNTLKFSVFDSFYVQ